LNTIIAPKWIGLTPRSMTIGRKIGVKMRREDENGLLVEAGIDLAPYSSPPGTDRQELARLLTRLADSTGRPPQGR
jgi:hypothetical protein